MIIGETLTIQAGNWSDDQGLTYSYQWYQVNGTDVFLHDGLSHNITIDDLDKPIYVTETVSDGTHTVTSNSSQKVLSLDKPVNLTPPNITGSFIVGQELTVMPGEWDHDKVLTITYMWCEADDDDGLNDHQVHKGLSYTPIEAGKYLRLEVIASDGYVETILKLSYQLVMPPEAIVNTVKPTISSTDRLCTVHPGQWSGDVQIDHYQWYMIEGEEHRELGQGPTYTILDGQENNELYVIEHVLNGTTSMSVESERYLVLSLLDKDAPFNVSLPVITYDNQNEDLVLDKGDWTDQQEITYTYQWLYKAQLDDSDIDILSQEMQIEFDISKRSGYIKGVVSASDGLHDANAETAWLALDEWIIDYVALGDSISKGYIHPRLFDEPLYERPYVDRLDDELSVLYPNYYVHTINFSLEGDETSDLLFKLDGMDMEEALVKADFISLCIGGNNILKAAKKDYDISPTYIVPGYDFTEMDPLVADEGLRDFAIEFPQIMDKINGLNDTATVMVMTVYNPINISGVQLEEKVPLDRNLVDDYLIGEQIDDVLITRGINTLIHDFTLQYNYLIADVYTRYLEYDDRMNEITYMYLEDDIMGIPLRNPHPNDIGQGIIFEVHKSLLD